MGGAPEALRERVLSHAGSELPSPEALATSARRALGRVLDREGDRSVALDLLAADALVTLALLAQAQQAPGRLGAFAAAVLRGVSPSA
jgi:hypothetical protein